MQVVEQKPEVGTKLQSCASHVLVQPQEAFLEDPPLQLLGPFNLCADAY